MSRMVKYIFDTTFRVNSSVLQNGNIELKVGFSFSSAERVNYTELHVVHFP